MSRKRIHRAVVFGLTVLAGAGTLAAAEAPSADALRAHVRFLADDLLQGREAGTDSFLLAARYVESQFRKIGLDPAGGDGYLQQVPFVRYRSVEDSAYLSVGGKAFAALEDFVVYPHAAHLSSDVEAPVVFAGFGIDAPELGRRDYEGLDVNGKIVAILSGAPASFPTDQRAHYSSSANKLAEAARHGAVGMLTIRTRETEERSPWERLRAWRGAPGMRWVGPDGVAGGSYPTLRATATLNTAPARAIFRRSGTTLEKVLDAAAKGTVKGRPLKTRVRIAGETTHERIESPNVLAVLRGSDPQLRDEYVVYTAHLDHVGVRKRDTEDSIHNGAYDNAIGVSILLETARAFASGERPKRSIIFAALTAEEKGLLGAQYFAANPTVPRGSIVANINLDMPLFLFPVADMIAYGADHSSLGAIAQRAAEAEGFTLTPDPRPEEVIFVRSDHYPFVQAGIPALYLIPGSTSTDPAIDGSALVEEFLKKHYHRPSDQVDLNVDWPSALRFTRANLMIGREVANGAQRPVWNEGDFFGDKFGGTASR